MWEITQIYRYTQCKILESCSYCKAEVPWNPGALLFPLVEKPSREHVAASGPSMHWCRMPPLSSMDLIIVDGGVHFWEALSFKSTAICIWTGRNWPLVIYIHNLVDGGSPPLLKRWKRSTKDAIFMGLWLVTSSQVGHFTIGGGLSSTSV